MYGIKSCDSVKKAIKWLDSHNLDYQFQDYRNNPVSVSQLKSWCAELGFEALLNRRSAAWRNLDPEQKKDIDESRTIALIGQQPLLLKRPLLDLGNKRLIGFNNQSYCDNFLK